MRSGRPGGLRTVPRDGRSASDRKSTRLNSSHSQISHAVFCLENRFGVVAIVAAQEFQWVFRAKNLSSKPGVVSFAFVKEDRRVGTYSFYVRDPQFGPGIINIC